MKLLEGYMENRTKEMALAAILLALTYIGRFIVIPLFIPPIHGLECTVIFWTTGILLLSYPYVWLFVFMMSITSSIGLVAMPMFAVYYNLFFILSRIMGLKRARYACLVGQMSTGVIGAFMFDIMGFASWRIIIIPGMIKVTSQAVLAFFTVPIILKSLNILHVFEFDSEDEQA